MTETENDLNDSASLLRELQILAIDKVVDKNFFYSEKSMNASLGMKVLMVLYP